jgi:glycosyltransferase involved in cell wall biosynthesis
MSKAERPKLRVSFVVDSGAFGGAHVYLRYLIRMMSSQVIRSLVVSEPVTGCFKDLYPLCERVVTVPLAEGRLHAPDTSKALAQIGADLNFVNLINPTLTQTALRAAVANGPSVAALHLTGDTGNAENRARLVEDYAALRHTIAISRPIEVQLLWDLRVPASRITRIRNGIVLPTESAEGRGRSPFSIGVVARLSPQKGLDILMLALRLLLDSGLDFDVRIAGEGGLRTELEHAAQGLPVTFLGHVQDISSFLRTVDVFCLPSLDEGLPLALLEAMAHGLPCIATRVGDVEEAVGCDAVLVPPGDAVGLATAIGRLMSAPDERSDLAKRARRRAMRDFSADRMVQETERVLLGVARNL